MESENVELKKKSKSSLEHFNRDILDHATLILRKKEEIKEHLENGKMKYLSELYGPGGVERINLVKDQFKSIIKSIVPPHYPYLVAWMDDFGDTSKQSYERYQKMPREILWSLVSEGVGGMTKGASHLCLSGITFQELEDY